MKKLFVLVALFSAVCVTKVNAQKIETKKSDTPTEAIEDQKARLKPELMSTVNLTEDQAKRVLNIHFNYEGRRKHFENAPAAEKKKETDIIRDHEHREYKAMELSDATIEKIDKFFADYHAKNTSSKSK